MKTLLLATTLATSIAAMSSQASANEHLALYAGAFGIGQGSSTVQLGLEYRGDGFLNGFLPWGELRPVAGVTVDEDTALHGYLGVNWDIPVADSVYITPSFVAGAYSQGAGRDLGGAIEFRSGLEVSYSFAGDSRLGLQFSHVSNAGLYDENPGAESLMVVYSHPVNWLSGE